MKARTVFIAACISGLGLLEVSCAQGQRSYIGGVQDYGEAPAPPPPVAYADQEAPAPADMPQPTYAPEPLPVSDADAYQYFYQPLSPYGQWVEIGGYGYCWQPLRVGFGWRPYYDGHWVWTECGWTWISEEPWGWCTYHYGRWLLTAECGWVWVPGRVWAPAWVCWRSGPDCVAWAPLPPDAAIGFGFRSEAFSIQVGWWTMVAERDFLAPRCSAVAFSFSRCQETLPRATTVVNITRVNNIIVNVGPGRRAIEAVYHKQVPVMRLRAADATSAKARTRVEANTVVIARPSAGLRIKPADIPRIQQAKRVQAVTVVKTEADVRKARTRGPTSQPVIRPTGKAHGTENAITSTPQKTGPANTGVKTRGESENVVRAKPANPEKFKAGKPGSTERIEPPTVAPFATPGEKSKEKESLKNEKRRYEPETPVKPGRVMPPTYKGETESSQKGKAPEKYQERRYEGGIPSTPKSYTPPPSPPPSKYRETEKPHAPAVSSERKHGPSVAPEPPKSEGGKEKGKEKDKPKD